MKVELKATYNCVKESMTGWGDLIRIIGTSLLVLCFMALLYTQFNHYDSLKYRQQVELCTKYGLETWEKYGLALDGNKYIVEMGCVEPKVP